MKIDLTNIPMSQRLVEAERAVIKAALEENVYNQSQTAIDLGISRGALRMKMAQAWGNTYFKTLKNKENKNK
jgi:DNA-binding NtrC family response regulator